MVKTAPVTVRLDAALNEQLETIAIPLDRPKSWVIAQAVQDFVALQQWQLSAIDEGIRAADAGELTAHEEVLDWVKSWDTPNEKPLPAGRT